MIINMGSLRFAGGLFVAYPNDHLPRHVHGFTGEAEVIVDLLSDGNVAQADRSDAIRPPNAKRSDVKKILKSAADHFEELVELWENHHGKA
jgi:phosphopantetheine adenylyltransferase